MHNALDFENALQLLNDIEKEGKWKGGLTLHQSFASQTSEFNYEAQGSQNSMFALQLVKLWSRQREVGHLLCHSVDLAL